MTTTRRAPCKKEPAQRPLTSQEALDRDLPKPLPPLSEQQIAELRILLRPDVMTGG